MIRHDPELRGRRVTVMGLGAFGGGEGLVRYLVAEGAIVTVTDRGPGEPLPGVPATFHFNGHRPEHFGDLVFVNPAVPDESSWLAGRELETEINLFVKRCPARRIVGVTGSAGKTTTTHLIAACLRAVGERVWMGGNVGGSLLLSLSAMRPDDVVVLELSSFQLERMRPLERSPHVAVVTNLTPNHLDRHRTMEAYRRAKETITDFQRPGDVAVVNEPGFATRGRRVGFEPVEIPGRLLLGRHNLLNMAAAAAAVEALVGPRDLRETLAAFPPVEHRLEWIGRRRAVDYFNDSKATTPDSTIRSMEAFDGPIVLIAGGSDKGVGFDALGDAIAARARAVVLLGQTAPAIEAAVRARAPVIRAADMRAAVRAAAAAAEPCDRVLLSPACASYDMFRNFVERGRAFKEAVAAQGELETRPHGTE